MGNFKGKYNRIDTFFSHNGIQASNLSQLQFNDVIISNLSFSIFPSLSVITIFIPIFFIVSEMILPIYLQKS